MSPRPDPVREALERLEVPEADAAARRAWAVVHTSAPEPARRRLPRPLLAGVGVTVAALAIAVSPPGEAVGDWVRERIDPPPDRIAARPAQEVAALPAPGRLLVGDARRGAAVVARDGRRTPLGRAAGATWSPRGLFVARWRGAALSALTPRGEQRWAITSPAGSIYGAAWSPDGYRIAYLTGAARLRVVAGDGSGDRGFARARPVTPAWRPGAPHTLAWVTPAARIEVRDVDSGALVWRSARALARDTHALQWSPDGRRLVALAPRRLVIADFGGDVAPTTSGRKGPGPNRPMLAPTTSGRKGPGPNRPMLARATSVRARRAPARGAFTAAAYPRAFARGRQAPLATIVREDGRSRIVVGGRTRFTALGELTSLTWSPDGRWLLAAWPAADEWILVRATGVPRLAAVTGVAARHGRAVRVLGWR